MEWHFHCVLLCETSLELSHLGVCDNECHRQSTNCSDRVRSGVPHVKAWSCTVMSSAWCEFSGRGILTDEMKYGLNVTKALQFSQEEGKKGKHCNVAF